MNAAFLFSGQLRGFPLCINGLKNNLFSSFESYDTFFYIPDIDLKLLTDNWLPTSVLAERDQIHPDISNYNNNITYSNSKLQRNGYPLLGRMQHYYLQWYGVKRVFELFDKYRSIQNINYDVIFRIRADIIVTEKFNYTPFNGITIPNHEGYSGLYDRFAFGPYEHMKYYCSKYDNFNNITHITGLGNSESKLKQHIDLKNIPVRFVSLPHCRLNKDGSIQP